MLLLCIFFSTCELEKEHMIPSLLSHQNLAPSSTISMSVVQSFVSIPIVSEAPSASISHFYFAINLKTLLRHLNPDHETRDLSNV
jgi:hypothetical protein